MSTLGSTAPRDPGLGQAPPTPLDRLARETAACIHAALESAASDEPLQRRSSRLVRPHPDVLGWSFGSRLDAERRCPAGILLACSGF